MNVGLESVSKKGRKMFPIKCSRLDETILFAARQHTAGDVAICCSFEKSGRSCGNSCWSNGRAYDQRSDAGCTALSSGVQLARYQILRMEFFRTRQSFDEAQ